ncbi:hypothetical protein DPMN_075248 [Dreissena polymorpha]|uniref:Helicase C-terminal domain-containing protein n=1 Tax=Dreissena polymorpha TaxID=45954 RepID=A0A9D3YGP7_DREPO|nr:hypothetical protein DPMN_075248 [Dreissena polymorpha]
MGHDDGLIRLLVATSAAGMGVNFKGLNQVINYGVPKNMDTLFSSWEVQVQMELRRWHFYNIVADSVKELIVI